MFGLVSGLISGAIEPIIDQLSETAARLARKVALLLFASLCLVFVWIALTLAAFFWLSQKFSPVVGALSIAGGYAVLAGVAVALALRKPKRIQPSSVSPEDARTEAARDERSAQIDDATAPLMAFLARFGLRREQLAVLAGASVAKRIGPLPLVALAIVGGFLLGRMWKGWRALPEILTGLMGSGLFGFGLDDEPKAEQQDDAI